MSQTLLFGFFASFIHITNTQSTICVWDSIHSLNILNGVYELENGTHNGESYWKQAATSSSCPIQPYYIFAAMYDVDKYWMMSDSLLSDWIEDYPLCDDATFPSNPTQCNLGWYVYWTDIRKPSPEFIEPTITSGSCPSLSCGALSVRNTAYTECDHTFIADYSNNVDNVFAYKNDIYFLFNPYVFKWICTRDSNAWNDCNGSIDDIDKIVTQMGWAWEDLDVVSSHSTRMSNGNVSILQCVFNQTTIDPTTEPSTEPTVYPTQQPQTRSPTKNPTSNPIIKPTASPTKNPTVKSSKTPTLNPTAEPSDEPLTIPSVSLSSVVTTVINITLFINGSISNDEVINTLVTYLIAKGINYPLDTDIIQRGGTLIVAFQVSQALEGDEINKQEMEDIFEKEYDGKIKVKDIDVNMHSSDDDDIESNSNENAYDGVWVIAVVCIVSVVCAISLFGGFGIWYKKHVQRKIYEKETQHIQATQTGLNINETDTKTEQCNTLSEEMKTSEQPKTDDDGDIGKVNEDGSYTEGESSTTGDSLYNMEGLEVARVVTLGNDVNITAQAPQNANAIDSAVILGNDVLEITAEGPQIDNGIDNAVTTTGGNDEDNDYIATGSTKGHKPQISVDAV